MATASNLSSVGAFENPATQWLSKNKPPAELYNRAKCSVGFAVKDGELRMKPDTTQIYVPMVRTNSTDAVGSKYELEVTYPDTTTTNITFTADTVGEIKLEEVSTAGKWADGKSVQLVLFNTNQVAVATNHIMCVAAPANSAEFPYLPGKVDSLAVGDWSMDAGFISASGTNVVNLRTAVATATEAYDNATNALATAEAASNTTYGVYIASSNALDAANTVYDAATNALAEAVSTSNTTYEVYTNKLEILAGAIEAYNLATNELAAAVSASNTTYEVYTNKLEILAGAIEAYNLATNELAAAVSASNTTYGVYTNKLEILAGAVEAYRTATNELAVAVSASNTTYEVYTNKLDILIGAIEAYDTATNGLTTAIEFTNMTYAAYLIASNDLDTVQSNYVAKVEYLQLLIDGSSPPTAEALEAAQAATNTAMIALTEAQATYDNAWNSNVVAIADLETKQGVVETKAGELATAQGEYDTAKDDYEAAVADLETKQGVAETKAGELATAQGEYDTAKDDYEAAVADLETKQGVAETKAGELATAQGEYDTAKDDYEAAVADLETKQGVAETKAGELATAQGEYDTAKDDYEAAVADLETKQGVAETKTGELETAIADCEAAEANFFVVFSGSVVANDEMGEAVAFFGSAEYREWAITNKVRNILLDCPEDANLWSGASLFSYATATNGKSGAYFLSMNGLSKEEAENYSEGVQTVFMAHRHDWSTPGAPEVLLVRADGTEAGALSLYRDESGCDVAENIARLDELVANAAGLDESANDDPAGAAGLVTAGTRDACSYPDGAGDGVIASGTLTVNDMIDCFQLTGDGWTGKKVVFALATEGEIADLAWPGVAVLRYDATSGECVELDGELSVFATNGVRDAEMVYAFSQEDIDAGRIFVAATAYDDDDATMTKFGGKSAFTYAVSAYEATQNIGIITFDEQPETAIIQEATNQVFNVPLYRLFGSDGDVSVKVAIDEPLTTATGRYEFVSTDLVWTNGETGVKYVPVTLKGSEYNDGLYDITLRIEEIEAMAGVEKYFTTYTISYGKEPTDEGQIAVVSVTPAARADGRIYVRYVADGELYADDKISIQVNRTGGKGPAAAYISWKNGKDIARETLSWANYLTGTQTAFLDDDFPEPGKSGYADVTVTVTSSNSVPMVKDGSTIKVRVMPADAPFFDDEAVTWSGVQYTTTATNLTALTVPAGMTVKSLAKISGTIPKGLKVAFVDGQLVVTGTPTDGTLSSTAVYWVTLTRDEGGALYSMPVTVTFENQSLEDVNPGFTSARSWTGLPLAGDGKLMGLLDLTVAKNGKTSARCRMADGKTVAFSAPGLAGVDADGNVSLRAEKSVKSGGIVTTNELSAVLGADGSLEASVACDGGNAVVVSLPAGAVSWSKDNTAARFGGNYVAAFPLADPENAHSNTFCFGATSMRFKCNTESAWKRGAVTFAGTLPNGKTVSGTATFVPTTNNATIASLPVFASSSSDTFSAMVDMNGVQFAATDGVVPFWKHDEGGIESLSYENDYDVIGALWSWADWLECFGGKFDAKTAFGMSFNLNRTSGIAGGVMRLDVSGSGRQSTLSWKGVALPDAKPSIFGAYWYNVSKPYTDAKGNDRKRTVRAGDAVELAIE